MLHKDKINSIQRGQWSDITRDRLNLVQNIQVPVQRVHNSLISMLADAPASHGAKPSACSLQTEI